MDKEVTTLETEMDSWEVVERQGWMKVLPSTWAFDGKGSQMEPF
jgi:hypothetical protein